MYLLDFSEITKGDKKFRIVTIFDPKARRKVVTKFLNPEVTVPTAKLVTEKDLEEFESIHVTTDLSGNVLKIE